MTEKTNIHFLERLQFQGQHSHLEMCICKVSLLIYGAINFYLKMIILGKRFEQMEQ